MSKISVLLSLYDKEEPVFLEECLRSLVNQSRGADEIVIVYDGQINSSLDVVVGNFEKILPLKIIKLSVNSGLAVALNLGLKHCTGDLIARIDTDDVCCTSRLEAQELYFKNNKIDILGSAAKIMNFNGHIKGFRKNPTMHHDIMKSLWKNPFIHPSVMFRKSSIELIGGYDEKLRRRQDYELWFRAARNNLILGNLDECLICYRYDAHTLKKQSVKMAWMQGIIGFKGSLSCGLGGLKAMYCFIPFFRSLFPLKFQVKISKVMKKFDTREN
ncbi:glycosyltransferase [Vibrio lentus]|uniref:glycosyltransferase n=1 Tax=Vibrio lentus TaxID=136468 RepID=UPI000C85AB14|nr:glycosyltransferase [Vibrio lentus]PMJ05033.1 hypothetical protein BCU32_20360 [Vibrio lentus]PMJ23548.1 hypothetical protein BCU29_21750 [Vibrio lentus]